MAVFVGKSVIYLVSQVIEPPTNIIEVATSDLRLSNFVTALYAAKLDRNLKQQAAITFLAPLNDAFSKLGLVMNYLLRPQARGELKAVLRYHALNSVAYLETLRNSDNREARYDTLEGSPLFVDVSSNRTRVTLEGPTIGGFPSSGQLQPTNITESDLLTNTGVLHIVDQVLLPPTLDITIGKLLQGAKASIMPTFVEIANMTWLLEGRQPDDNATSSFSAKTNKKHKHSREDQGDDDSATNLPSFTLLCPTDNAFGRINVTYYMHNLEALRKLVQLHVIPSDAVERSRDPSLAPSDGRPLTLSDDATYDTLLSVNEGGSSKYGTLAFRQFGQDGWVVGIKNAKSESHDSARVVNFGRATPRFSIKPSSYTDENLESAFGKRKRRARAHRSRLCHICTVAKIAS